MQKTSKTTGAGSPVSSVDSAAKIRAQWSGVKRALALYGEAQELYAQGRYSEAYARLLRAVQLDPRGKELHYNLGLVAEKRGRVSDAIGHYRDCLRLEKAPHERRALKRVLRRLKGVERSEGRPQGRTVERSSQSTRPRPPTPAPPRRPLVRALLIGSSAAAGVGLVLGGVALAMHSDAPIDVEASDAQARLDQASHAKGLGIAAGTALGLAGLAAGAGLAVDLLSSEETSATATARTRARLSVGLGAFNYRFCF